ncbi:nuclear transport factor 2 family protein [Luteolibacter marinus]|uniref:nuclear transport factor 2 family protein n=1 Tax=Luteolibacter marinus TaxID=2776705 RepID=UPI001867D013|nr:nuclear transport factor 2 family protein [Luteolibacter marinus]
MKRLSLSLCLAILVHTGCKRAGTPAVAPEATALRQELQALNDKLTDAYEREDVPLLRELLSDQHIHNNVFGSRLTKDAFLKDIESGVLSFTSYKTPEIEWFIDGNTAIATGLIEALAERGGKAVPATKFRFTRVFRREAGEWKVLLFQNTMIPDRS